MEEQYDVATEEGSRRRALAILIAWSWGSGRSYVVIGSVCKMVAQSVRSLLVFFGATLDWSIACASFGFPSLTDVYIYHTKLHSYGFYIITEYLNVVGLCSGPNFVHNCQHGRQQIAA